MTVRSAHFGRDVLEAADLLFRRAKGKSTEHLCRSRVDQCVKRSKARGKGLRVALAAVDGDVFRGFLYAEERQMFDICPNIRIVEVPFLVGSHGAGLALLTRLRTMTHARIHVLSTSILHRPAALRRLLKPLSPEPVAVVYEV